MLGLYWLIYFLVMYAYVQSTVTTNNCGNIMPTDPGYQNYQAQRFNVNSANQFSSVNTFIATLKFTFGFDTTNYCIQNNAWVMTLFFSWLPFILSVLAFYMTFETAIIAAAQGLIHFAGAAFGALLAFFGL